MWIKGATEAYIFGRPKAAVLQFLKRLVWLLECYYCQLSQETDIIMMSQAVN